MLEYAIIVSAYIGSYFQPAVVMGPYSSTRDCLIGAAEYIETMEQHPPLPGGSRLYFRAFCAHDNRLTGWDGYTFYDAPALRRMAGTGK